MTYRDEQDRLFDEIELKAKLRDRLEKREKLAQMALDRGFRLDDELLKAATKLGKSPDETADEFVDRFLEILARQLGVVLEP